MDIGTAAGHIFGARRPDTPQRLDTAEDLPLPRRDSPRRRQLRGKDRPDIRPSDRVPFHPNRLAVFLILGLSFAAFAPPP